MTEVINFESIAKNYKCAVAAKYRPLKPGEISSLPQGDIYVSKKIDGELWLAYIDKEGAKLFAKGGRFINEGEIIESLKGSLPKNIDSLILAGELYVQNNKRERVGDVSKAISEKDGKKLVEIFEKSKDFRKSVIKAGQDTDKPDFGRK